MIDKEEIREYAKLFSSKPWQVEKEYFQHILLQLIYANTSGLVFKGGTAIKKAYGLKRFSEDLDFTQIEEIDFEKLFQKVSQQLLEKWDYQNKFKKIKIIGDLGATFRFDIIGPLIEKSGTGHCFINIDISKRETPKTREVLRINPEYRGISAYTVIVMSREEIITEKVRAIIKRDRPRDIYDLWYLLSQEVAIRPDWIQEKLAFYKIKFSKEVFFESLNKYDKNWNTMQQLTKEVPDLKDVLELIKEKFNAVI